MHAPRRDDGRLVPHLPAGRRTVGSHAGGLAGDRRLPWSHHVYGVGESTVSQKRGSPVRAGRHIAGVVANCASCR
jgi:hypothetical protein